MKILVVGGGSGGHITPAVAVVQEIYKERPRAKVFFWTNRKYYKNVIRLTAKTNTKVSKIISGKFNRYSGWHFKDYFINWKITLRDLIFRNIIGFFGFVLGLLQSLIRLLSKRNRPDIVFLKGGFVSLPVGLAAQFYKIPYIIHESDMTPGLANRLLMKRAKIIATGFEQNFGNQKTINVGIPVSSDFKSVTEKQQRELKKSLGFDPDKLLTIIVGGSQGSENINEAVKAILPNILKLNNIGLVAGKTYYDQMRCYEEKFQIWDDDHRYTNLKIWDFHFAINELMGAADIVISRAGATTIAELAALKKAVILVPFERLPGSHQAKNAKMLEESKMVISVSDEKMQKNPRLLLTAIKRLTDNREERILLANNLHKTAHSDAAKKMAILILEEIGK